MVFPSPPPLPCFGPHDMAHPFPGDVRVLADDDALLAELASHLLTQAVQAVRERGWFHLALSGGRTPESFFVRLVTDPLYRAVPWGHTHIWMVDERVVPADHDASNFRMIRETLLEHLPMRRRQWHPIPAEASRPAERYGAELTSVLGKEARLDYALLGLGEDGHTASLFPNSTALNESTAFVVESEAPGTVAPRRVTLTYPALNGCRDVAVLAMGVEKAAILRRVADGFAGTGPGIASLPMCGIRPADGDLTWFLDEAAAGRLDAV